jgi:prevent-host-death family protein
MPRQWELQEAKVRFSDVVEQALTGEAQVVTHQGRPAIVVVSYEEYKKDARRWGVRLGHLQRGAAHRGGRFTAGAG